MMKYMTHCLAVFIFFLTCTLSGQDVEISMDHPDRVNAGDDFEVTVTIRKGSLTDYSRFSQDLPPGLTATNVSSPNADFSFDEHRVRIIWLKLPDSNEIKVTYRISVNARLKGNFVLGGVFAYVIDDERRFMTIDQRRSIAIIPSSTIDPEQIVDIKDFREGSVPVVSPSAVPSGMEPFAMAVRQKPELLSSGGYLVHLLIDNPPGSKYAKVEESIPSGYAFEEVNSSGAVVSLTGSTVKFIWMKMPAQSEFEVVYRLVPKQNETQGNMVIDGSFTYTSENENKVVRIEELDVSLEDLTAAQKRELLASGIPQAGGAAQSGSTQSGGTQTGGTQTGGTQTGGTQTGGTTQNTRTTPPENAENTPPAGNSATGASGRTILNTKVLQPGTGVFFMVQLSANLTAIDATTFYRDLGIDQDVYVEQENGYFKYTVGPFQTYEQALSYKDEVDLLPEVEGAFVVGYRNGHRVSAGSIR